MEVNDNLILNEYFNIFRIKKAPKEVQEYVNNRFSDSLSVKETIQRIRYKVEVRPVCKICGKPVKYYGKAKRLFSDCCLKNCANKLIVKTERENCLKKYGLTHNTKRKSVREKISKINKLNAKDALIKRKQTCLEKYGVENVFQNEDKKEKIKKTCLERYGVEKWSQSEIGKQTLSNILSSKDVQEKAINTCLKKYGVPYVLHSKKNTRKNS